MHTWIYFVNILWKKINYKQLQDYQAVFLKDVAVCHEEIEKKYNEKHSKYSKRYRIQ